MAKVPAPEPGSSGPWAAHFLDGRRNTIESAVHNYWGGARTKQLGRRRQTQNSQSEKTQQQKRHTGGGGWGGWSASASMARGRGAVIPGRGQRTCDCRDRAASGVCLLRFPAAVPPLKPALRSRSCRRPSDIEWSAPFRLN